MAKIDKIEELQNLLKEDQNNHQARRQLAVLLTDCGFSQEALKNLLYLSKNKRGRQRNFLQFGYSLRKTQKPPKSQGKL